MSHSTQCMEIGDTSATTRTTTTTTIEYDNPCHECHVYRCCQRPIALEEVDIKFMPAQRKLEPQHMKCREDSCSMGLARENLAVRSLSDSIPFFSMAAEPWVYDKQYLVRNT